MNHHSLNSKTFVKYICISFALKMNSSTQYNYQNVPSELSDGVPACCWSSVAGRGWDRRRQSGQESESERVRQQTESEKVGQKSERVGQAVIVKVIATCQSLPSVSKQCS